jgi:hypothetical protein
MGGVPGEDFFHLFDRDGFAFTSGRVTVDENGPTIFNPVADGKDRYLVLEDGQKVRTFGGLILLARHLR